MLEYLAAAASALVLSDAPIQTQNTQLAMAEQVLPAPVAMAAPEPTADPFANLGPEQKLMVSEGYKFVGIELLRPQGSSTNLPSTFDTVFNDKDGWRTKLASKGWYVRATAAFTATADVLNDNKTGAQAYTGQRTTVVQNNILAASYTFPHSGKDITQINFGVSNSVSNYDAIGPDDLKLSNIDVFTSFFDRKVEIKGGIGRNVNQFVGIFAGGNTLLANGLGGVIPIQAGMSSPPAPTPFLNVQLNGPKGFYSKTGIQRSLRPEGLIVEAEHNGFGLKWSAPGARALYIQEFGVVHEARPGQKSLWVRGGAFYNTSNYTRFDNGRIDENWMAYGLADVQVYQPEGMLNFYRGIFAGVTAYKTSDKVNLYTSTIEGRIYQIGMVPHRPFDLATFNIGYNTFSDVLADRLAKYGQKMEKGQLSISGLYNYRISRGVYMSNTLTYFDHPTYRAGYKPALNYQIGFNVLF